MSESIEKEKQPYKKPSITVVDLAADEVLAVGCKTGSSGPPGKNPSPIPPNSCMGPLTPCVSQGS